MLFFDDMRVYTYAYALLQYMPYPHGGRSQSNKVFWHKNTMKLWQLVIGSAKSKNRVYVCFDDGPR